MRSVKIGEQQADVVKDFKKYLKEREGVNTTEAEILTRAVDLAVRRHYNELVEELTTPVEKKEKSVFRFILENPQEGEETNASEDHDLVGL